MSEKTNTLGLTLGQYKGAKSTLCSSCGHDAITVAITKALYEVGIEPHRVAKLSGIGCSSKTTAYFLGQSHGLNGVHGRMAAIAAGVSIANRDLFKIGVSGDGDTASIGLGNFLHMVRRNVPMVYIVENNGCYGLTKGQFSATADIGSAQKGDRNVNQLPPVDICALAVEMGCGYVARSFSGDPLQLKALIEGAISYHGTAVIDVISPCVTFNNHESSTKSLSFSKSHKDPIHEIDFIPNTETLRVDYQPGETINIDLPDGSHLVLKKLEKNYDPHAKIMALTLLNEAKEKQLFYTGLFYYTEPKQTLEETCQLPKTPLVNLPSSSLRPTADVLDTLMERFR